MIEVHSIEEFKKVVSEINKGQLSLKQGTITEKSSHNKTSANDLWNSAIVIPGDDQDVIEYIESIGGQSWSTVMEEINDIKGNSDAKVRIYK